MSYEPHWSDECPCGQWGGCADVGGCEGCCHLPTLPERYRWISDLERIPDAENMPKGRCTFHFDLVEALTSHPRGYAAIALDMYGWQGVRERAQRLLDDELKRAAS